MSEPSKPNRLVFTTIDNALVSLPLDTTPVIIWPTDGDGLAFVEWGPNTAHVTAKVATELRGEIVWTGKARDE